VSEVPSPPKKEVEFRVQGEDWSKYEILDGKAVVWVRVVLLKLYELSGQTVSPGGVTTPVYEGQTQFLVTTFFDESLRTNDTTKMQLIPADEIRQKGLDVPFQALDEPWNEYLVSGPKPQLLRSKCVASRIHYLANRYNRQGDPGVWVEAGILLGSPRDANAHNVP